MNLLRPWLVRLSGCHDDFSIGYRQFFPWKPHSHCCPKAVFTFSTAARLSTTTIILSGSCVPDGLTTANYGLGTLQSPAVKIFPLQNQPFNYILTNYLIFNLSYMDTKDCVKNIATIWRKKFDARYVQTFWRHFDGRLIFWRGRLLPPDQLCSSSQHSRIGFRLKASWFWQGAWRYIDTTP